MAAEKITHEKIIHAVLDCAFVNSVGATSLADIAGKLGIKKASLYNHYESRDAMIEDTVRYCGEYLRKVSLIPAEMDATARKYAAEAVLKGLVHRWFKVNEKEPVILIYSFVESEKYFSTAAASICSELRTKLVEQTAVALTSLASAEKIKSASREEFLLKADFFVILLCKMLDEYIVEKKKDIRLNPPVEDGGLFNEIPLVEPDFDRADRIIELFCQGL